MDKDYSKSFVNRFVALSVLITVILWLIAFIIELMSKGFSFTFTEIVQIHRYNSIFWLFDLLPFAVGFGAFYFSKSISIKETESNRIVDLELKRSRKLYRFVEKLNQGNISADYQTEETDALGKAIVHLRDNLNNSVSEQDERQQEDYKRHWSAEGLANFGEILRSSISDMNELGYEVISNLVKYIKANQGGFYFLHDDEGEEAYFELVACYAYERKKFTDQKIAWGEGLIGACGMERDVIHMKKVPDSYINITSGLGQSNPRAILLVPMIVNEEIHGVFELATFDEFEPHVIEFARKVAESVAATISSVKVNMRTAVLLNESQKQAEALAEKEEQMRQNMEELQATQEEAARQGEKFISFTNSVNHTLIRAEYKTDGTLIYANTKFLQKLGYAGSSEVEGKHISLFLNEKDRVWFDEIWESLSHGGKHFEGDMKHMTKQGLDLWTIATYTCIRGADGKVDRVLFLAIDTTEQKKQSLDYQGQIHALNRSSIKVEFNLAGEVMEANDLFFSSFGYTQKEIQTLTLKSLSKPIDLINIERIWDDVTNGIPYEGQLELLSKTGESKWFRVTFSSVHDMYGDVSKVVLIATDNTKAKLMEIENRKQNETLKKQEEILRRSEENLSKRLKEAKAELKSQFAEIEQVKIRNEKTLEGFLDAIIMIDSKGLVQFFNKASEDLWQISRDKVIGQNVNVLFPADFVEQDEFIKAFVTTDMEKTIGSRKEVNIVTSEGDEIPVLMLLSEAVVGRDKTYTAFIQNIEVELF